MQIPKDVHGLLSTFVNCFVTIMRLIINIHLWHIPTMSKETFNLVKNSLKSVPRLLRSVCSELRLDGTKIRRRQLNFDNGRG